MVALDNLRHDKNAAMLNLVRFHGARGIRANLPHKWYWVGPPYWYKRYKIGDFSCTFADYN